MPGNEEAKRWLSEAAWDLETARILHDARRYNSSAFLCQQGAEKAAKALLYSIGEAPFGQSVRALLQRFGEASKAAIPELVSYGAELDRHYVPARYPNAIPSGTPHENYDQAVSQRTQGFAEKIVEYAKRRIE